MRDRGGGGIATDNSDNSVSARAVAIAPQSSLAYTLIAVAWSGHPLPLPLNFPFNRLNIFVRTLPRSDMRTVKGF